MMWIFWPLGVGQEKRSIGAWDMGGWLRWKNSGRVSGELSRELFGLYSGLVEPFENDARVFCRPGTGLGLRFRGRGLCLCRAAWPGSVGRPGPWRRPRRAGPTPAAASRPRRTARKLLGHRVADNAGDEVGRPGGRVADYDADGLVRVGFGLCMGREGGNGSE